jgi:hypothetical protein
MAPRPTPLEDEASPAQPDTGATQPPAAIAAEPESVLGPPLERRATDWHTMPTLSMGTSTTALADLAPVPQPSPPTTITPARWSPASVPTPFDAPQATAPDRVGAPTPLPDLETLFTPPLPTDSPAQSLRNLPNPNALFEQFEQQLTQLPLLQPSVDGEDEALSLPTLDELPPANTRPPAETLPLPDRPVVPPADPEFVRPDPIFGPLPTVPPRDTLPPLEPGLPPEIDAEIDDRLPPRLPPEVEVERDDLPPPSDRPTLIIPDPSSPPLPEAPPSDRPVSAPPPVTPSQDIVELTADRQDFNEQQQVFVAEGNVEMRYQNSILRADRLRVNLVNRFAIADGNVVYLEPGQLLQGNRIEYNFVRREGTVFNASGQTTPEDDPLATPRAPNGDVVIVTDPETEPREDVLPLEVDSVGSLSIGLGFGRLGGDTGGGVQRVRFEAEQIEFYPDGWSATNVRLTNDPFSPPELELRSNQVTFTRLSATRSEIRARNPRLVFDQGFTLPLLRDRVIIDEQDRGTPLPFSIGIDERDRDGVFLERTFEIINNPVIRVRVSPQFYIQRAFDEGFILSNPDLYGVTGRVDMVLSPTTTLAGRVELTSLRFEDEAYDQRIRANLRIDQQINRHLLSFQSAFRDRVFNGSLGFQTVRWTYGLLLTSPTYRLGNTGINLTYQGSISRINAVIRPDRRDDLLPPRQERNNNRATLTRYQVGFTLSRPVRLWTGEALPATREEGLRFTPEPLVPFVGLVTRLRGFSSFYSSGDTQPGITAAIGVQGQLGHLSRDAFDYLAFNLTYSITPEGPKSPFNFDRLRDRQVLSGGIVTQLFGPVLVGFQTSYNLTEREEINTNLLLQYQRRTYSIVLQYSPTREIGSFGIQINDFNWRGATEPFSGSEDDIF